MKVTLRLLLRLPSPSARPPLAALPALVDVEAAALGAEVSLAAAALDDEELEEELEQAESATAGTIARTAIAARRVFRDAAVIGLRPFGRVRE
jgi:hypothetical protein